MRRRRPPSTARLLVSALGGSRISWRRVSLVRRGAFAERSSGISRKLSPTVSSPARPARPAI
eukprot:1175656-Prorocentrum_minimum.AAC.4